MEKIQLIHPQGKKLNKMDLAKYEPIKSAILSSLDGDKLTHDELLKNVRLIIGDNFPGSIGWHAEGVKLDLEARGVIARTDDKPQKYYLTKKL